MCWEQSMTFGKPEKLITEKDITVYKIMAEGNDGLISYITGFRYKRGDKYELRHELLYGSYEGFDKKYRIEDGFHSYDGKCTIKATKYNVGGLNVFTDMYDLLSTYHDRFWKGCSIVAVECIIPKGSVYYRNEYGEIVSDRLVVTEWSITAVEIRKRHRGNYITFQELFNEMKVMKE